MTPTFKVLAAALLLFGAPRPAAADEVDDYLDAQMRRLHIPGLSLAVVRDGRVLKSGAYGLANVELNAPVTEDTVFEVGSITKQFTAALVMMLVEEGKLGLDDAVAGHLPGFPEAWGAVTVRHLLTHCSGIQNYLDVPGLLEETARPGLSHGDIAKLFFGRLRQEFPPGETWSYSNTGYLLLGNIVEGAGGKPYWELLDERVFKPAGMNATRGSHPAAVIPGRAAGYEWRGNRLENRPALTANAYAAGSVVSTARDLARWDAALRGGGLLKEASLRQMWTPFKAAGGAAAPFDYGFGWFVDSYHGRRVISHGGGTPGCSSLFYHFPEDGLTVIILTNHGDRVIDHLAIDVAGFYVPALARPREAGSDPDEKASRGLRKTLSDLFRGESDPASFTPAMQAFLRTGTGEALWQWVAADGELKSFAFSEQEGAAANRVVRYKAVLGDTTRWFSFTVTADGRIARIGWW